MMVIKQIGEIFPRGLFEAVNYFSDDYLLEADILIIDLNAIVNEIAELHTSSIGRYILVKPNFTIFKSKIQERNEQLLEYFEKRGNLFLFLSEPLTYDLNVVESTTIDIFNFDLLSTIGLDSKDFELKKQKGNVIEFSTQFKEFFDFFNYSYNLSFTKYLGKPIGAIGRSKYPASIQIPVKNGNIIVLPNLTPKSNPLHISSKAFEDIDRVLKEKKHIKGEKIEAPEWAINYTLGEELNDRQKLTILMQEKEAINLEISNQNEKLEYYNDLKRLLFSTGTDLELITEHVLTEIGYKTETSDANRDDLILSCNTEVAVVEIKGVKGSAAESHAAQLMKWVNNYHLNKNVNPKGILIVNAFKDKPLNDRTENSFPNQMLPYSKQMKFCLLTTTQLLELYLDFKDEIISFEKIHQLLFSSVGVLKYNSTNKIQSSVIAIS